jgi:hypothetical protein
MEIMTKEELIAKLIEVRNMEWVPNARPGNAGGVGNTLEDLLDIEENNLPIPNAAEWELKCQRMDTASLITLFHIEPSPRALRFVPQRFLPLYGWHHQTIPGELSFRQTITGLSRSDRGFKVVINRDARKVLISFNAGLVDDRHADWLRSVENRVGLRELNPQPYWGFDDLWHKAGTKLLNCFYIRPEVKRIRGREHYWYKEIMVLERFSFDKFLLALERGSLLVDFDARTGHNHGTKFRLRQGNLPFLYERVRTV